MQLFANPYQNICPILQSTNAETYKGSLKDMNFLVDGLLVVVDVGVHGHMFRFALEPQIS